MICGPMLSLKSPDQILFFREIQPANRGNLNFTIYVGVNARDTPTGCFGEMIKDLPALLAVSKWIEA